MKLLSLVISLAIIGYLVNTYMQSGSTAEPMSASRAQQTIEQANQSVDSMNQAMQKQQEAMQRQPE